MQSERLVVSVGEEVKQELRFHELETLVVAGNVQLTSAAIAALLDRGVAVAFLSQGGKFHGRLEPPTSASLDTRRAQFRILDDAAFALELTKRALSAKALNARALLMRGRKRPAGGAGALPNAPQVLRTAVEKLAHVQDTERARGIEGEASAAYFARFGELLVDPWTFDGRSRRPPLDPPNALLSLGYTLLLVKCLAALQICGLDVDLGFCHSSHHGSPALALDFMEEFRPAIVDVLVVQALNEGVFAPDDFVTGKKRPVELTPPAFRKFVREFERRLATEFKLEGRVSPVSYGDFIVEQARALRSAFVERTPEHYVPHVRRQW